MLYGYPVYQYGYMYENKQPSPAGVNSSNTSTDTHLILAHVSLQNLMHPYTLGHFMN